MGIKNRTKVLVVEGKKGSGMSLFNIILAYKLVDYFRKKSVGGK